MKFLSSILGKGVESIAPDEAYRRLQAGTETIIVDVRQPVETRAGSVPGAVLIPLTEFGRRMGELPHDRPILTICRSGHRSPLAARQLRQAGYDVTDVAGGTMAWERAGLPLVTSEG
jgi:rhodanese-related sulfurtransferase